MSSQGSHLPPPCVPIGRRPPPNLTLCPYIRTVFSTLSSFTHRTLKMELTLGSETSAFKTQTPGNNPEDCTLHIYIYIYIYIYVVQWLRVKYQCFQTLCLFHLHRRVTGVENV